MSFAALALIAAGAPGLTVTSPGFKNGQPLSKSYSGEGVDHSPRIEWTSLPKGTKELALVCEDPDAPDSEPWVHWVVYKIPVSLHGLPQGIGRSGGADAPPGVIQGLNSFGRSGYNGPAPPPGHGWHRYFFTVYALKSQLPAKAGLSKSELLKAMKGHILAEARIMGKYKR